MPEITTSTPQLSFSCGSNQQAMNSKVYRSKPPSSVNKDTMHQQTTWLCWHTDNMEYQLDMFTYALNGDGTAHGKQSPLSSTSVVYDHYITQGTGYTSTRSISFSCETDSQTNTGVDIHKTHYLPLSKDTDMRNYFGTSDQNALRCSAGTQTTEPVVSVSIHTEQVSRRTQCIAIQHHVLKKINFQTDSLQEYTDR